LETLVTASVADPEELERIAVAEVAARFNLPNDKLLALAAKYPPPQEWLETKEDKPFSTM
jgi:hypothetical protein